MLASVQGTITKLTNGTATRLDKAPTSEAWPKNHMVNGSSDTVIRSCVEVSSCTKPRSPSPRFAMHTIRNATPTNDNQKPAANTLSGSNSSTTNKASASDCNPLGARRNPRASATTAIMSKVRTVGSPKPASAL